MNPGSGTMMRPFTGRNDSSSDTSSQLFSPPLLPEPPASGSARPIRLVYGDEKGTLWMDPEAVGALQLIKGLVGIVSVCGHARQWKTFILNQLLGGSRGFQVASTHLPCTDELWLWSAPLKRTALDGTEFNLLLLDGEGINGYDQMGKHSTQIFSLAVLLSSMFIHSQEGGLDDAALDRLSLVTQMTRHIGVRATGGRTTASEPWKFSPIFVWLLRDLYLDIVEDNRRITPREYLELALRPMLCSGKDIAAKNEIRDSIRALFPNRECFILVQPTDNVNDLQRLDQFPLDQLSAEFRSGLDALKEFVFERTRPKEVGDTILTGPLLVDVITSYLEAINNGAVRIISSPRESVEEAECRRAFKYATEVYKSSFDRSKQLEDVVLREAQDEAVRKSLALFNFKAVGVGSVRKKYEGLLQTFYRKEFEDYRRNSYAKADLQCSIAIQSMEKSLKAACNASGANMDGIVKVLDTLLFEYEASSHGPGKWQKVALFLQQSFKGPVLDFTKKLIEQARSENRSLEGLVELLTKQMKDREKCHDESLTRLQAAFNRKKQDNEHLLGHVSLLDEECRRLSQTLDSTEKASLDWKSKYEKAQSAQKEAEEWEINTIMP